jgi:acetoin utilization protein AcuA
MMPPPPKEDIMLTARGEVRLRSFCKSDNIREYKLDSEFTASGGYKPLYTQKESLAAQAQHPETNLVLALASPQTIIGFGVLAYPEPGERWAELGAGVMMEVKAIEVARSWRQADIASRILKLVVDYPQIEDKIFYMVGYSWTWDLEGTQKTAQAYRAMLVHLFERHGFQVYETNEPNVCLKPENVLMCRLGNNISRETKDRFKWLRFGLRPWAWNV